MTLIPSNHSDSFPRKNIFLLPVFIAFAFAIYLPVLHHFFISDDFSVLYRVCIKRTIFIRGFFRPLSDLTIYANYLAGGLNPIWFNSFNILIHGINSYLLFLICKCLGANETKLKTFYFAILSSVLFICYPFHNEAIVWLLGRGANMACLFALSGLLCYYKIKNETLKPWASCVFYFISLTAFESTMIFPLIMLLLLYFENEPARIRQKWIFALGLTLGLHLLVRYWLSGSILGLYGNDFFHSGFRLYFLNIPKTVGRLILPPSKNVFWLSALFLLLVVIVGSFIVRNVHRFRQDTRWKTITFLSAELCISCIIPFVIGVSTQTSETDRLLYFPSVFVCMIGAFGVVFMVKRPRLQWILIFLVIAYNLAFLELNNMNWRKASFITMAILEKINEEKRAGDRGRIFFLNIPNEVEGAYVFRMGFPDALLLYKMDSSRFIAVNYLPRRDLEKMQKKIVLKEIHSEIVLPPDIVMKKDACGVYQIFDHGKLKFITRDGDQIYFWNTDRLEGIQSSSVRFQ